MGSVSLGEAEAGLHEVVGEDRNGKRPAFGEDACEVAALEQLHHEVRCARVQHADVRHAADMLAAELRRGPGLAQESLDDRTVTRHLREQELERHALPEVDMSSGYDEA